MAVDGYRADLIFTCVGSGFFSRVVSHTISTTGLQALHLSLETTSAALAYSAFISLPRSAPAVVI